MSIYWMSFSILAETSENDWSFIGLVFFLSGFVFYGAMFLRYRNADKRFRHETLTRSETENLRVRDDLVRSQKGLTNSRMRGANNRQVSGSLNTMSKLANLGGDNVQQIMDQVNKFRPGS